MRGDVVLYRNPTSWDEKLTVWATHGPFYHCEIAIDDIHTIGAHKNGIQFGTIPTDDPSKYTLVHLPPGANIEAGLTWAKQQLGKEYGWLDIVYQAVKFLAPNNSLRFGVEGHYDCSDFAARYLIHAGVTLPDSYLDTATVTPNDLARWAGLIAPRKGVA